MGFEEDLKIGERAEQFILEKLRGEFPTLRKVEGYCPDYDFIDDSGYTIELKFDSASKKTGNIAIEYKHRGKPTGIATSKAIEWIIIYYHFDWRYIRITSTDLKAFLKNNWTSLKKFDGKGDKSSLVLIPTGVAEQHLPFNKLKNI